MSDFTNQYSFLDETEFNSSSMIHDYKSLKPARITAEFIEYDFPTGSYFADSFFLSIKFDGQPIPRNDLTIDNFISEFIPYYDQTCRTLNNKNIMD